MTPLKMIGTQRSAHTHKKARKKIKEEEEGLRRKQNPMPRTRSKSSDKKSADKNTDPIFEQDFAQDEEINEEQAKELSTYVTIMIVKLPSLCKNGFGTRYQVIAPEGYG